MALYRKKPIIVDAVQYKEGQQCRGVLFQKFQRRDGTAFVGAYCITIHGQFTHVADGDWIIMEPDGEHYYPCKPDIFEASYEPVPVEKEAHDR